MLIRNFSAHLEEGGGERKGREPLSLSCSLLSPCFLPILHSVSYPGPATSQPPLLFPRVECTTLAGLGLLYLDADLSFLCTATGKKKISNPCLLASLPFLCTHTDAHTHSHTHLVLFAFSQP